MNEEKNEILNRLYNLVLDRNIREHERNLLFVAKEGIESGNSVKKEITQLEIALRPLAIRYTLTPLVDAFYDDITSSNLFGLGIGAMRDRKK